MAKGQRIIIKPPPGKSFLDLYIFCDTSKSVVSDNFPSLKIHRLPVFAGAQSSGRKKNVQSLPRKSAFSVETFEIHPLSATRWRIYQLREKKKP
jgi:hypothetical protein